MKRMLVLMVCLVATLSISASASIYGYGTAAGSMNLTNGDWTLASSGDFFGVLFSSNLQDKSIEFKNIYGGETYPNRGAYIWTAPAGEEITEVGFYWNRSGYLSQFSVAVFAHQEGNSLADDAMLWSMNGNGSSYGDGMATVTVPAGTKSIGLGFLDTMSDLNHTAFFNEIHVSTTAVPEPMTLGLLTLGGLMLRRRK